MKIVVASDHASIDLKVDIKEFLEGMKNIEVEDIGAHTTESVDYPDFGQAAGEKVTSGGAELAIIFCGTGIGISIAANKVKGVRAALCHDIFTARMAKQHNNANVMVMGGRILGKDLARAMVKEFLELEFEGGRHQRRLDKIAKIEEA